MTDAVYDSDGNKLSNVLLGVLKDTDISNVQSDSTTTVPSSALLKSTDDKIGDTSSLPGDAGNVVSAITQLNSDIQNVKTKISIAGFLGTSALNDVLQTGFYVQTINSNATPENNYPVAIAGLLEVFRYNDMWIFQRYTTYQNKMYIRSKYSSTFWETWTNIN